MCSVAFSEFEVQGYISRYRLRYGYLWAMTGTAGIEWIDLVSNFGSSD